MPATRIALLPDPFVLHAGGQLQGASLAYETWGTLNSARDNVVLILTGLSPSAHAASSDADPSPGWWEQIIGPGKPIDSQQWFVVCVNSLGSCKGSTGPASIDPSTGTPYRMRFPDLSIEDVARAAQCALREIGIEQVHACLGPSMGGMSTLAYVSLFPGSVRRIMLLSSAAYSEPFSIAIRSLQRELIYSDPGFNGGNYAQIGDVSQGMRLARKLGVISYRGAEEWRFRFGRQRIAERRAEAYAPEFEIERYLEAHADRFAPNFDPICYLQLSRAMDRFDFADYGDGSLREAARRTRVTHAEVIGVTTDILFPLHAQEEVAAAFKAASISNRLHVLPSPQAHDAFLVDMERFAPIIARFMRQ